MLIRLQDIVLQAHHGVFAEEREQGNTFKVRESVANEMQQPSNLLEHVAGRIRAQLVRLYPEATVHVQVSKKNPPLGGEVAWATVEL